MVEDAIDRKIAIMEQQQNKILKTTTEIMTLAANTLKDSKTKGDAKVSFLNIIKIGGGVSRDLVSGMESKDKLEVAKTFLQTLEHTTKSISDDPYYTSILNDLNLLISNYNLQIKQIDSEFENLGEKEKLEKTQEKKDLTKRSEE